MVFLKSLRDNYYLVDSSKAHCSNASEENESEDHSRCFSAEGKTGPHLYANISLGNVSDYWSLKIIEKTWTCSRFFLNRTGWGAWWSSWPWAPAEKRLTVDLWIGLAAVTDDELRDTVLLAIVLASMVDIFDDDCWVNLFCVSGGVVDDTITLSTTYPSRGEACRICVQKIEKRKVKRDGVCPYTPCTHRARNPEPTNDTKESGDPQNSEFGTCHPEKLGFRHFSMCIRTHG